MQSIKKHIEEMVLVLENDVVISKLAKIVKGHYNEV